jgi:hypothetical protein
MMTCFTSIAALGGRPALSFVADEQVDAVAQLAQLLSHPSPAALLVFGVFFAIIIL